MEHTAIGGMPMKKYSVAIVCPWCGRGKTLAEKTAEGYISSRCHACGKCYEADLKAGRAEKVPLSKATKALELV